MMQVARLAVAALLALGIATAFGCQNGVTGPSLSAVVESMSLSPTLKVPAGENICCCHVVGTVKNTSSIDVHIQLEFPATAGGVNVGMATILVRNVTPGAVRTFEAIGIQSACSSLSMTQIAADQRVRAIGLWEPPQ